MFIYLAEIILKYLIKQFRCTADFTEVFYWKNFLQPLLLVYGISMAIFLYITVKYNFIYHQPPTPTGIYIQFEFTDGAFTQQNNWSAGIGHSCCCYIQLLILCDVGTTFNDAVISIKPFVDFAFVSLKKR